MKLPEVKSLKVYAAAIELRDRCMEEMSKAAHNPEFVGWGLDHRDARVEVEGHLYNALDVLHILNALGVPGCRAR